ncbi:MAG: GNAT family N-acetyltransferase [Cyclobacteriaceae bacterium]
MTSTTIRKAVIDDLDTLYEFEQGIIAAERPFDPTLRTEKINYYDLKALVESEDTEVLVAVVDNEIAGSGYVQIRKAKPYLKHEHYGYIGFMFVKAEFRGKGIAQLISNSLTSWAKSNGLHEIRLDVYNDNHSAVRAYEKAGFKKHMIEMRMTI